MGRSPGRTARAVIGSTVAIVVVVVAIIFATKRDPVTQEAGVLRVITLEGQSANFAGEKSLYHGRENELEMRTGLDFYSPTIIVTPPHTQMIIEMENESVRRHTFTAPALGVDREFQAFDIQPFFVEVPGPGTYVFYCRFHQDQGMRGAIRVGGPPR